MSTLVLLVLCFGAGWASRRYRLLPDATAAVLNAWVINVSLPALVVVAVHRVEPDGKLVVGVVALWLVFLVAVGASLLARRLGWLSRPAAGGWALCAGLGNTAFVGLPLVESLGGAGAVGPATVLDQLGTFLAFSVAAVPYALALAGNRTSAADVLRRLARFPPFLALVVAALLRPVELPAAVLEPLTRLGAMVSPLALAAVGFQLRLGSVRSQARPVAAGLVYKLLAAPAVVLAVLWLVSPSFGLTERVVVAQAAMAPMVTASVVAAQNELEPALGASLVGVGVPLSFLTVPGWWWLLERL